MSKIISISTCNQCKILMRYFTFLSSYNVFKIWCTFYNYSTSQFVLTIFKVLNEHMWLMVTILNGAGLEHSWGRLTRLTNKWKVNKLGVNIRAV